LKKGHTLSKKRRRKRLGGGGGRCGTGQIPNHQKTGVEKDKKAVPNPCDALRRRTSRKGESQQKGGPSGKIGVPSRDFEFWGTRGKKKGPLGGEAVTWERERTFLPLLKLQKVTYS